MIIFQFQKPSSKRQECQPFLILIPYVHIFKNFMAKLGNNDGKRLKDAQIQQNSNMHNANAYNNM